MDINFELSGFSKLLHRHHNRLHFVNLVLNWQICTCVGLFERKLFVLILASKSSESAKSTKKRATKWFIPINEFTFSFNVWRDSVPSKSTSKLFHSWRMFSLKNSSLIFYIKVLLVRISAKWNYYWFISTFKFLRLFNYRLHFLDEVFNWSFRPSLREFDWEIFFFTFASEFW